MATSAGAVTIDLVVNSKAFENKVKQLTKGTEKSFDNSFSNIGRTIAAAFSVAAVTSFAKSAVSAASEVQAAWTGLNSIVEGTGNSFAVAQNFINEYTKDGLVSIEETATAYKNLLSRGYDTTQIENTLTALKDSAAFGRQASYDLGEAVVSATEGLKNENSILVDNAGVTKNVAKMWDEYAASVGKTANNLTQAEKIQAEYNGIMKETRFQTGDAATYTKTFAGQVQILKGSFSTMQAAIGKVVAPIAQLFIPYLIAATNAVTNFFVKLQQLLKVFGLEMPDVVSKTSSSVDAATSSINGVGGAATNAAKEVSSTGTAAKKAAKEINKAFGGMDEINVLNSNKDTTAASTPSIGTGTGAGTNAAVAITPTVASDSAISTAVGTTIDKIMKYIEPLKSISFDNLINMFDVLKESVVGLGGTIWKGLEWAYFNLLVPLAKWTIEDALPAFFYALSGALDAVSGILEEVYPSLDWLWNNFLQPIASWTGDVVISALYSLGDALKWVGKNADIVVAAMSGIAAGWATFKGLKILGSIVQFVKYAGRLAGVTGVVKSVGAAFAQLWTYFKGGAAVKAVTGAFGALKGAIVAVAAALGVSVGVVVAIIAAIAALVAGIILLIKNWDKVKEVVLNVWDSIKETLTPIANWFNDNVIQPIIGFFTGLWNKIVEIFTPVVQWFTQLFTSVWASIKSILEVIVGLFKGTWELIKAVWGVVAGWFNSTVIQPVVGFFTEMWNKIKNAASSAWEGIKAVFSPVVNWFKDKFSKAWEGVKNVFSTGGKIFSGIKEGIEKVFKTVVNGIISGINKVIAVPFNAINKLLNKIRNVSVAGVEPFKDHIKYNALSVPQIPMLANGGWLPANNPQLAIVGDNKREPEIVTPESKIYDQVAKAIKDIGVAGKQQIEIIIHHKYEDGRTIIQKVNQAQIDAGQVLLLT